MASVILLLIIIIIAWNFVISINSCRSDPTTTPDLQQPPAETGPVPLPAPDQQETAPLSQQPENQQSSPRQQRQQQLPAFPPRPSTTNVTQNTYETQVNIVEAVSSLASHM